MKLIVFIRLPVTQSDNATLASFGSRVSSFELTHFALKALPSNCPSDVAQIVLVYANS